MSEPENVRKMSQSPWAEAARLRCRAEEKIRRLPALQSRTLSVEEAGQALEELRVHQIELEMQSEELPDAQATAEISRTRYFDLYDLAPIGYCKLSSGGIILEANLTTATLFGMERGALDNLQFAHFIQREDRDICYFYLKSLFESSQRQVCELRVLRRNSEPFWARLESIVSRDENDAPLCHMAISDITETRRAQEEAHVQKEILEKVFESAPYIMVLVNNEMRVTKINRACADFSGRSKEELIGLLAGEVYSCLNSFNKTGCGGNAPCSDCPVRSTVRHTFKTCESTNEVEGSLKIRKGSADIDVDILISTTLIKDKDSDLVLLTIADVTERTRAQKALRDSEERFRELAENIRDIFWVRTSDKLLYISPAYEQVSGRSRESFYRDPASFLESVHPDHRDRVRQAILTVNDQEATLSEEFQFLRPDGTVRWLRARSFPVSRQGRIIRRVGVAEDITASREAEEFLRIEKDLAFGLGSSANLVEGMNNLLGACLQVGGLDSGGIYLVEKETGALRLVCHQGLSKAFVEGLATYEPNSPQARFVSKGGAGYWQKPFKGLAIADLVERDGILAFGVIPVKYEEEVIAALSLASHHQPQIPRSAQTTIEVIAAHIGGLISRVWLTDAVKSHSERLQEANAALKVLLKQRGEDRNELEESLLKNVRHLIKPYLEKLKKSRLCDEQKNLVEILESHLLEIASPFVHKISAPLLGLTATEIRVAELIRQGKSSKEISSLLGISDYAVIFHRQGIRRKLGLIGKKRNLQIHLCMLQ